MWRLDRNDSIYYYTYMSKAKQVIPTPSDYAVQAHQISRASYTMPVMHRRLIYLAMAQVRPDDEDLPEVEMTVGDIARALNLGDSGRQYVEIRAACAGALSHVLDIDTDDGWVQFQWLSRCRYVKTRDAIKIKLHDDLRPYVLELQSAFSMLSIADISRIQGRHALRLFEQIMSNKGMAGTGGNKPGHWFYDIEFDHLRHLFKIAPHEYKLTADLRKWVIDAPVREINDADLGIRVECDYNRFRRGRRLLGVRLNVRTLRKAEPKPVHPATASEAEEAADLAKLTPSEQARYDDILREELAQGELALTEGNPFKTARAEARALARLREEQAASKTAKAKKAKEKK